MLRLVLDTKKILWAYVPKLLLLLECPDIDMGATPTNKAEKTTKVAIEVPGRLKEEPKRRKPTSQNSHEAKSGRYKGRYKRELHKAKG